MLHWECILCRHSVAAIVAERHLLNNYFSNRIRQQHPANGVKWMTAVLHAMYLKWNLMNSHCREHMHCQCAIPYVFPHTSIKVIFTIWLPNETVIFDTMKAIIIYRSQVLAAIQKNSVKGSSHHWRKRIACNPFSYNCSVRRQQKTHSENLHTCNLTTELTNGKHCRLRKLKHHHTDWTAVHGNETGLWI